MNLSLSLYIYIYIYIYVHTHRPDVLREHLQPRRRQVRLRLPQPGPPRQGPNSNLIL